MSSDVHTAGGGGMFSCSQPLAVFDQLRVPYTVVDDRPQPADCGLGWLRASEGSGGTLFWPALSRHGRLIGSVASPQLLQLGSLTLHARVLPIDELMDALRTATAEDDWGPAEPITDVRGRPLSAVCRSPAGGIALPVDPDEVVQTFWTESYRTSGAVSGAGVRSAAKDLYYRVRPVLPRSAQIAMRRLYARVQERTTFPAWPLEGSLHGFCQALLACAADVAGRPVPWIGPWPGGYTWALVLTHDVETAEGLSLLPVLREIEKKWDYRSSWNFVPKRYDVTPGVLAQLRSEGCEVGVHGLYHDGRDLESARTLGHRLPEIARYAAEWGAVGFRSPATQRDWDLIGTLPFEYDSSYPDTDPFEPQSGGCCSWWPLMNGDVVELPITLAQDHTVFVILRRDGAKVWLDKTEALRRRGGMALIITHPDYVGLGAIAEAYDSLLARHVDDATMWRPLPKDLSRWWRRRDQTHLRSTSDGWRVVGPAAPEANVQFAVAAAEGTSVWSLPSQ